MVWAAWLGRRLPPVAGPQRHNRAAVGHPRGALRRDGKGRLALCRAQRCGSWIFQRRPSWTLLRSRPGPRRTVLGGTEAGMGVLRVAKSPALRSGADPDGPCSAVARGTCCADRRGCCCEAGPGRAMWAFGLQARQAWVSCGWPKVPPCGQALTVVGLVARSRARRVAQDVVAVAARLAAGLAARTVQKLAAQRGAGFAARASAGLVAQIVAGFWSCRGPCFTVWRDVARVVVNLAARVVARLPGSSWILMSCQASVLVRVRAWFLPGV